MIEQLREKYIWKDGFSEMAKSGEEGGQIGGGRSWAGPSGIPGYPGIPGLISNPDPGILENLIPGFFGIYPIKQNSDFKDFYWVLTQICPKNPGIKMLG